MDISGKGMPLDANAKPVSVLYAFNPVTGGFSPLAVKVNADGTFTLKVDTAIEVEDIEIGAVEIKDATSDVRTKVSSDGKLFVAIDENPLNQTNLKYEYTYVATGLAGAGKVKTVKIYPALAVAGAPAKLTTYYYNSDDKVETVIVTDVVV